MPARTTLPAAPAVTLRALARGARTYHEVARLTRAHPSRALARLRRLRDAGLARELSDGTYRLTPTGQTEWQACEVARAARRPA